MRIADFNYFDWFLVLIVAFSMVAAFRRGLVRAIFGLLGIIAGFQLAAWNYRMVGDWIDLSRIKVSLSTARVIAFLMIVVVVAALLELAGRFLQKLLRHVVPAVQPRDRMNRAPRWTRSGRTVQAGEAQP